MKEYTSICSQEELWESVADEEAKPPLKNKVQVEVHRAANQRQRFWEKRPVGMVIDKEEKVCYVLEFKRVMERYWVEQEK